jgi:hypothetical protein
MDLNDFIAMTDPGTAHAWGKAAAYAARAVGQSVEDPTIDFRLDRSELQDVRQLRA